MFDIKHISFRNLKLLVLISRPLAMQTVKNRLKINICNSVAPSNISDQTLLCTLCSRKRGSKGMFTRDLDLTVSDMTMIPTL